MSAHVRKVTVAIGNDEYAWAARSARRAKTSVSAVLTEAAREKRATEEREAAQGKAWAEVVSYVTRGAVLSASELSTAERELTTATARRPKTTRRRR